MITKCCFTKHVHHNTGSYTSQSSTVWNLKRAAAATELQDVSYTELLTVTASIDNNIHLTSANINASVCMLTDKVQVQQTTTQAPVVVLSAEILHN